MVSSWKAIDGTCPKRPASHGFLIECFEVSMFLSFEVLSESGIWIDTNGERTRGPDLDPPVDVAADVAADRKSRMREWRGR